MARCCTFVEALASAGFSHAVLSLASKVDWPHVSRPLCDTCCSDGKPQFFHSLTLNDAEVVGAYDLVFWPWGADVSLNTRCVSVVTAFNGERQSWHGGMYQCWSEAQVGIPGGGPRQFLYTATDKALVDLARSFGDMLLPPGVCSHTGQRGAQGLSKHDQF